MDRLKSIFSSEKTEETVVYYRTGEPYEFELESYRGLKSRFESPEDFLGQVSSVPKRPRSEWRTISPAEWVSLVSRRDGLTRAVDRYSLFVNAWLVEHSHSGNDNFLDYLAEDSHICLVELEETYVLLKMSVLSLH